MTWIPTYGHLTLICDGHMCGSPPTQQRVTLNEDETHEQAQQRMWSQAAPAGWTSQPGMRHHCPADNPNLTQAAPPA